MNGFKRASRRQAAIVGLAVLMGASFLGCHSGPRLFSKNDRDSRADKQELAEKDKGKFINKKKARPESDYRRADEEEERFAKSDPKANSKAKPSDTSRKPSTADADRIVAARKPVEDESKAAPRSTKATTVPSKTTKPADQPQVARRDPNKRPVTDLLGDSMFDDKLPEPRPSAPSATAKKTVAKPAATAKANPADEDPFKKVATTSPNVRRANDKVAKVNFDDEDLDLGLDDEQAEEAEELAEARALAEAKALAAKKNAAVKKVTTPMRDPRATPAAATVQRKYLDDLDEPETDAFTIDEPSPQVAQEKVRANSPAVKRTADTAKTIAGQEVIDRRPTAQQTASQWRRDLERDEQMEPEQEPVVSAPRSTARPTNSTLAKGHLSPVSLDEFAPPSKSQGAVLNGELIIDTNTLPSRFQRSSSSPTGTNNANSTSGRINSNSGANIDIAPGSPMSRPRPAGQISLQALSDAENTSGLTTADYASSSEADGLGGLPSLKIDAESETGPKLASLEVSPGIAPPPPNFAELTPAIGATEPPPGGRGWKRTLLVLSAMVSALGIGFALRRRSELAVASIPSSNSTPVNRPS